MCLYQVYKKCLQHPSVGGKKAPQLRGESGKFPWSATIWADSWMNSSYLGKRKRNRVPTGTWHPKEVVWNSQGVQCEALELLRTRFTSRQGADHRGFHLPSIYKELGFYILYMTGLKGFKRESGMVRFYFQVDNAWQ